MLPWFCLKFDFQETPSHGELQTRPMCCTEPDDVQHDLNLYGCGQMIKLNDVWVVFALPSTTMLFYDCMWRPPVTNSAIVSPPPLLHAVLNVAVPGEALSLTVSIAAWHTRGRRFAPRTIENKCAVLSAFLFWSILLFSRSNIISLGPTFFLKTCAVMCEVIQLLYSNDQ